MRSTWSNETSCTDHRVSEKRGTDAVHSAANVLHRSLYRPAAQLSLPAEACVPVDSAKVDADGSKLSKATPSRAGMLSLNVWHEALEAHIHLSCRCERIASISFLKSRRTSTRRLASKASCRIATLTVALSAGSRVHEGY